MSDEEVIIPEPEEVAGPEIPSLYMMDFTRYDGETGRILYSGNCTNVELEVHRTHGPLLTVNCDVRLDYVDLTGQLPQLHARPFMNLVIPPLIVPADGNSTLIIGNIPAGTNVNIQGPVTMSGVTEGEDLELAFSVVGIYTVLINNFPYNDERLEIHAT